jgi:hypothetical protein
MADVLSDCDAAHAHGGGKRLAETLRPSAAGCSSTSPLRLMLIMPRGFVNLPRPALLRPLRRVPRQQLPVRTPMRHLQPTVDRTTKPTNRIDQTMPTWLAMAAALSKFWPMKWR